MCFQQVSQSVQLPMSHNKHGRILPPGTSSTSKSDVSWKGSKIKEEIVHVLLEKFGFENMTPVQAVTIPHFIQHKDVAVEAPTGSGKTIAFVVPVLQKILALESPLKRTEVGALIIAPTRELSMQISDLIGTFLTSINENLDEDSRIGLWRLIGGSDVSEDLSTFKQSGCNIIVGTPGRIEDTFNRMPEIRLRTLEVLVLDEADRLLDLGFEATITSILHRLPKQRRTGLFSATLTKQVTELVKAGMRNPVKVSIKVEEENQIQATPNTLSNYYIKCELDAKLSFLVNFLNNQAKGQKVIIFFSTGACVTYFWKLMSILDMISNKDTVLLAISGKLEQKKRSEIMEKFDASDSAILFSTNVSARGLDYDDIDWVIQFDAPQDPSDFVHRVGRTARNGRNGKALILLLPAEITYLSLLENRQVPIDEFHGMNGYTVSVQPIKPTKDEQGNWVDPLPKPSFLASLKDWTEATRNLSKTSREMMEQGVAAFISFVRAYKENRTNYIFRLKDLDFGALAKLFGLLKLPRMEEFNTIKVQNFEVCDVDLDSIPYEDKKREKKRKKLLEQKKLELAKQNKHKKKESTIEDHPTSSSSYLNIPKKHDMMDIDPSEQECGGKKEKKIDLSQTEFASDLSSENGDTSSDRDEGFFSKPEKPKHGKTRKTASFSADDFGKDSEEENGPNSSNDEDDSHESDRPSSDSESHSSEEEKPARKPKIPLVLMSAQNNQMSGVSHFAKKRQAPYDDPSLLKKKFKR